MLGREQVANTFNADPAPMIAAKDRKPSIFLNSMEVHMGPDTYATSTAAAFGNSKSGSLTSTASISQVNTPLTDRLEAIINDMIDTTNATVSIQEGTFGRLFGHRPCAGEQSAEPLPDAFEDRINIKLQRLHAAIREANTNAAELSNRI